MASNNIATATKNDKKAKKADKAAVAQSNEDAAKIAKKAAKAEKKAAKEKKKNEKYIALRDKALIDSRALEGVINNLHAYQPNDLKHFISAIKSITKNYKVKKPKSIQA